jgi:LuxR family transcriptional regulator, maltose regulon positive regulatory protein
MVTVPAPPALSKSPPSAADNVLLSKITPPACREWVIRRSRIEERIAAGPLTVVTGPPGAGKTTAVASWLAVAETPVAWVTLDRYDSRPDVFWSTVVAALRSAGVEFRRALPAPGRAGRAGHEFVLRLAVELVTRDPPVTLVLDDFHRIAERGLDDDLQYLIRNTQPGLRVVICSRVDPTLSLHQYRLAGELAEIRADELAFSVHEAQLLLNQHGVVLPEEPLERLTELNEGWAAGLRMAALLLQEEPDPEQFVKKFAAKDSAIADYLIEEVLKNQPARHRVLLLKTSILDQVSAGLAVEMTGDEGAGDALEALARANAFVEPVGNGWYRFHALFAEVLRLKLRFEHPGQVADLHRRAARWYQSHQRLPDAVRQAAAAGDWLFAARLVVDDLAIGPLIEAPDHDPLTDCLRAMPPALPGAGPEPALVAAAIALADVRHESARTALAAAEDSLAGIPEGEETTARIAVALLRLELAQRTGDIEAATASVRQLEKQAGTLPDETLARRPQLVVRMLAERGLLSLWAGEPDEAAAIVGAGHPASAEHGPECANYHGHLALAEAFRGRLHAAGHVIETTCWPGDGGGGLSGGGGGLSGGGGGLSGGGGGLSGAAEVALALIHLERNELRETRDALKRADAALRARPDRLAAAAACFVDARCRLAEGHTSAASDVAGRARVGWSPPGWLDHRLTLLESRAFAAAGDNRSAVAAAGRAGPAASLDAAAALAHARLATGDLLAAGDALDRSPAITAETPVASCVDWRLTEARLAFGNDDGQYGRQSLMQAMKLGEQEGLRLSFALEASWMRPVLRNDPRLARAYRRVLAPDPASGRRPSVPVADPVIVEELTGRECEVLKLLARMLTTAEVAGELYISVNTVKTHLKSIYRKLAANHRGEAVRRAKELRLI